MAAKIQKAFPGAKVDLVKGGKGAFIVTADGNEVWNKHKRDNEFPNEDDLVRAMRAKS